MAMSQEAKQQAMSAVREARPYIDAMRSASHADLSTRHDVYPAAETRSVNSMPQGEKHKAMSAVREAAPHVRMMRETGSCEIHSFRSPANSNDAQKSADRIARMQKSGYDASSVQKDLTKQDFGRDR